MTPTRFFLGTTIAKRMAAGSERRSLADARFAGRSRCALGRSLALLAWRRKWYARFARFLGARPFRFYPIHASAASDSDFSLPSEGEARSAPPSERQRATCPSAKRATRATSKRAPASARAK